ncbi:MAG: hypothetical protein ACO1SV_02670 [Fimbriimonas sp.]
MEGTRFDRERRGVLQDGKRNLEFWIEPTQSPEATLVVKSPRAKLSGVYLDGKRLSGTRDGQTIRYKIGACNRSLRVSIRA